MAISFEKLDFVEEKLEALDQSVVVAGELHTDQVPGFVLQLFVGRHQAF